jgi:hypothetical protein
MTASQDPERFPSTHAGPHEPLVAGDPLDLVRSTNPSLWHARAHTKPRRSGSRAPRHVAGHVGCRWAYSRPRGGHVCHWSQPPAT